MPLPKCIHSNTWCYSPVVEIIERSIFCPAIASPLSHSLFPPRRWAHAVGVAGAQSHCWSSQMNPSVLLLRPCPSSGLRQCCWRIIGSCHKQPQAVYRVYVIGATCTTLETLQAQQWPPMARFQSHSWIPPLPTTYPPSPWFIPDVRAAKKQYQGCRSVRAHGGKPLNAPNTARICWANANIVRI